MSLFSKAAKKALGGGIPGAAAMVLQVLLLMWLRAAINYMYKNGGTMSDTFAILYAEGGIGRFYQGLGPALLQGPLSRFGDTAANEGVTELLTSFALPTMLVTFCASIAAGMWRVAITPLDTVKTMMQVEGSNGLTLLGDKIAKHGYLVLFDGALGAWAATTAGHFPWSFTNNQLEKSLPQASSRINVLARRAFIGLCASFVSDCISNGIRVLKVYKQTAAVEIGYVDAFFEIVATDGVSGLMLRGLSVKIISNAISSILFSILWKYFIELYQGKSNTQRATSSKKNSKGE